MTSCVKEIVALFAIPVGIIATGFEAVVLNPATKVECPNCHHKFDNTIKKL
jgi:uncharacterized membrane protein YvlD (DUF360 family)